VKALDLPRLGVAEMLWAGGVPSKKIGVISTGTNLVFGRVGLTGSSWGSLSGRTERSVLGVAWEARDGSCALGIWGEDFCPGSAFETKNAAARPRNRGDA
jgi:hypothetical protein